MKARVKATEEIVEVKYTIKHISNGELYKCIAVNGKEYMADQVELIPDEPDYWEKLKHQYAGMAMQGILSNQDYCKLLIDENNVGSFADDVSRCAKDFATALVEKLKNE